MIPRLKEKYKNEIIKSLMSKLNLKNNHAVPKIEKIVINMGLGIDGLDKKILETWTSNLLFVKDKKFFTPKKDYYEGNTYKFFKSKIKRIIKKDILLKEIKNYDEILLLGSGKGVTSVKSINEIKWKRKSLKKFNFLSKQYDLVIKNCNSYRF